MVDKDVLDLTGDLDRLLRQELSLEPSPAFAARVRERIAQADRTRWWRGHWIPAAGSFATVASLALAITVPAITRSTPRPVAPAAPDVRLTSVQPARPDPRLFPRIVASTAKGSSARRAAARVRPDLPEVIVDARQGLALATLFRMMEQGRVSGDSFSSTVPVSLEPIADHIGAIAVEPVVVSAMPPGGVLPNSER